MPRKPRRAKLTIGKINVMRADLGDVSRENWVRLVASNGHCLMHSETYSTTGNARRAKADIEAAMVDYLESRGYVVTKAEEAGR